MANGHYYYGRTVNFAKRRTDHLRDLGRGKHKNLRLQACFDKYGLDYFLFLLVEALPAEEQQKREQEILDEHYARPECLNLNSSAATCSVPWTDERKQRIASAAAGRRLPPQTKEARARRSAALKGHSVSETTRQKISAAHKGRKLTPEHKLKAARPGNLNGMFGRKGNQHPTSKPLEQLDPSSGLVVAVFGSAKEAGRCLGCCSSYLSKAARGVHKSALGFHWRYQTER